MTVIRNDLEEAVTIERLEALSSRKRNKALENIREACEDYVNGPCLEGLSKIVSETTARNALNPKRFAIEANLENRQVLYPRYPTATLADAYATRLVTIESGGESALDPNSVHVFRAHAEDDVPHIDLGVADLETALNAPPEDGVSDTARPEHG